ncbi:GGDEF domain-containing protein [Salinibius halmophilus]|uniref:GGDEF domain-containing protein n=1 Tax=Salinibius halmophilus TaxID=1853216 RepID=UPI000E6687E5|nr:GGDEF domain-containing protein [Salinibius halmophilus]
MLARRTIMYIAITILVVVLTIILTTAFPIMPLSATTELPAFLIVLFMMLEVYQRTGKIRALLGWMLIAIGIVFDFADEFIVGEFYWFIFDEIFVQVGLAIVCLYFLSTISKLNQSISLLDEEVLHSKTLQSKLTLLAYHDQLTGLLNRRAFFERFELFRKNSTTPYLVYIDLDNFKQVNDRLGHNIGDEVLIRFAGMLRLGTRDNPHAFRFGGDEFVVLCEQKEIATIETVLSENFPQLEHYQLGYSLGYVAIASGVSADKMLSLADEQMYERKNLKRRNARSKGR